MSRAAGWHDELQGRAPGDWPALLSEHSGLPGPRANLPLVDAVAELASQATVDALLDSGDQYLVMCAAAALGWRGDDPAAAARARALASDERWRVREGVAIGLQLLGDRDLPALLVLAQEWADDPDPLVGRAAVAALCEPRLLRDPQATAAALALCQRLTARIAALPAAQRRGADVRTLRQALGYCWSVAIAADPAAGLPTFGALDVADPDVAWIVRTNTGKKRLASLLPSPA